jgi:hypothetical protein
MVKATVVAKRQWPEWNIVCLDVTWTKDDGWDWLLCSHGCDGNVDGVVGIL